MNAYHNLAGWLRDLRAVLNDRASYDLADSYYWQLCDLLTEMLDDLECNDAIEGLGPDESDADDLESTDADVDVVVQRSRDSGDAGSVHRRSRTRSVRKVGGSAGMADTLPRDVQASGRSRRGRAAPVAGAGKRVTRGKK